MAVHNEDRVRQCTPFDSARRDLLKVKMPEVPSSKRAAAEDVPPYETIRAGGYDGLALFKKQAYVEPLLTPAQEVELAAQYKKGDAEARERMILANQRFVVKLARDFEGQLPLMDLVSEGNIGLMSAVESFNPLKGAKLSTWGSYAIKSKMRTAIHKQSKDIRVPQSAAQNLSKLEKETRRLTELLDAQPTVEELAHSLGWQERQVLRYQQLAQNRMVYLDAKVGSDTETENAELIEDTSVQRGDIALVSKEMADLVSEVVTPQCTLLSEREKAILRLRFGFDGNPEGSPLEAVGEKFGVTRERIRQIQDLALKKIRAWVKRKDTLPGE